MLKHVTLKTMANMAGYVVVETFDCNGYMVGEHNLHASQLPDFFVYWHTDRDKDEYYYKITDVYHPDYFAVRYHD